jgi:membrane protease YdiL (CAAX protease family)
MGLLASIEGGITEEVELRLFLLSFLALGIRYASRFALEDRDAILSPAVFWPANVAAAVLFGLGHLPVTSHLIPLTPVVIARAIVLNAIVGLVAGYLFWRRGIEMAMLSHFSADIVLHVVAPLLQPLLLY